jgi:prepilin-type N-terminal cleavage/methylation domain-containing protein
VPVQGYRPRAGFTLVEAMIVVVIIGLIAAFAVPKLDFTRYRLNGAARSVVAVLNQAQRLAVTDQNNVNVLFDVANRAIIIHNDMNNNNQIDNGERARSYPIGEGAVFGLGPSVSARVYSPAPVTFTRRLSGKPELIFRRDGSASEAGAVYVSSTRSGGRAAADTRSIEVTAATGRVEWYRFDGTAWTRKF